MATRVEEEGNSNATKYALKVFDRSTYENDKYNKDSLVREARILSELSHKNVIKFVQSTSRVYVNEEIKAENKRGMIVTEYADN